MTFDEWFEEYYGKDYGIDGLERLLRHAWDAALAARHEEMKAERDKYLAYWVSVRDALPVSECRKGRWQYELFYNGYWYVKKSHAERAIAAATEKP